MKKRSIALFTYLPLEHGGGLATFYKSIATSLSKRYPRLSFTVITLSPTFADKITRVYSVYYLRKEDQPTVRLESKRSYRYVQAKSFRHLTKLLGSFDVVYSKNDFMDLMLLAAAGFSHIKQLIIGFHTPIRYHMTPTLQSQVHNAMYDSWIYKKLLAQASAFHVLNNFHRVTLSNKFRHIPVHHIYNPVHISAGRTPKQLNNSGKKRIRLLWIGRLTQDKGADDLIWLIKELQRESPGRFEWTIVGDGPMRSAVEKGGAEIPNISYLRALPHGEVLKLYWRHDAFVMTSKWECLPYVAMEAQHAGLPVYAYDIPGCKDIVIPGAAGVLVKTPEQLKRKLNTFVRCGANRRAAISLSIEQRFNPKTILKQLYNLFNF